MMERELRALELVANALAELGIRAVLFGGLGVYLTIRSGEESSEDVVDSPLSPGALRRLVRVTADVDIAVPASRLTDAADALTRGLHLEVRRRDRTMITFVGELGRVDLAALRDPASVSARTADLEAVLAYLPLQPAAAVPPFEHVLVADPASLVVLKAAAYLDRYENRDLVDVVLLALWDRRERRAARRLDSIRPALPEVHQRRLRELGERVAAGRAAAAFLAEFKLVSSWDADADDEVAELLTAITLELLSGPTDDRTGGP